MCGAGTSNVLQGLLYHFLALANTSAIAVLVILLFSENVTLSEVVGSDGTCHF
ncbi:hypothetical protein SPRA44_140202 [Serratia proteamaculans]|nr:hypothetical protein SPRA44_140202 [Serratia proteamaculans]